MKEERIIFYYVNMKTSRVMKKIIKMRMNRKINADIIIACRLIVGIIKTSMYHK